MLDLALCRARLQRLLAHLEREALDAAVLSNPKTIYYFSGALVDADRPQALAIRSDGRGLLATNREPAQCLADDVRIYTAYTLDRVFLRHTMNDEAATLVKPLLSGRIGLEYESVNAGIAAGMQSLHDLTPALQEMRRVKDADELREFRNAIEIAESAYGALRRQVEPGLTELDAYCVMYEAAVHHAQTSIEFRGDFACGTRAINEGGPPTARRLEPGDLYILDLFPTWNGFTCDLCRTFAVTPPDDVQMRAWERVMDAHRLLQAIVRPGVPCREIYQALREHLGPSFTHHAGHGVGMDAWEYPWLNAGTDQTILEGEILAIEPAVYGEEMRGGIRLEHNYLVGRDGVAALDTYPLELWK